MEQARVLDIKHFAIHDGEGIRTTVFLKGCPLKCVWCHNPEGIGAEAWIGYVSKRCMNCGECTQLCKANSMIRCIHQFDRGRCNACGKCVRICPGGAFTLYGNMMTSEEVFQEIASDREFYENSGGGMTISGGECLVQHRFCRELLYMCRQQGINTAIDTCGYVSREAIDAVCPYTDIFLYDIKAYDEDVHIRCTGKSNKRILQNLKYIATRNIPVEVRIPLVPGYNDEQIKKIAIFLKDIKNITAVKLLPYHRIAGSKYEAVGMINTMPEVMPTIKQMEEKARILKEAGLQVKF